MRLSRARRLRKLPSARAIARSRNSAGVRAGVERRITISTGLLRKSASHKTPRIRQDTLEGDGRPTENARRREMEESYHGIKKRAVPKLFNVAADEWLELKKPVLAERSYQIEEANLKHVRPMFGKRD
jgi:hypothetical protein